MKVETRKKAKSLNLLQRYEILNLINCNCNGNGKENKQQASINNS
jgi:hypothetical protein